MLISSICTGNTINMGYCFLSLSCLEYNVFRRRFERYFSHHQACLCSFVFHLCSTCVHLCFTCVHLCSTCVHLCSTCVHLCSFVFICFICVHLCSIRVHLCSLVFLLVWCFRLDLAVMGITSCAFPWDFPHLQISLVTKLTGLLAN